MKFSYLHTVLQSVTICLCCVLGYIIYLWYLYTQKNNLYLYYENSNYYYSIFISYLHCEC